MRFVGRQLVLLAVAVQFLTRLPTPRIADFQPDWPVRSVRFSPLVGHLVGASCAGVWLLADRVWGPPVAAVLAVGAGALITGGFHEDGLADTADGLGGGVSPARRLEIMKDSRIGSYGALALLTVAGVRVAALASLAPVAGALALIVAHGAARAAAILVMRLTPYVGDVDAAKGRAAGARVGPGETAFAAVWGLTPLLALGWLHALAALALIALSVGLLTGAARRLIGGHTGDVLGACEQLGEASALLAAAGRL